MCECSISITGAAGLERGKARGQLLKQVGIRHDRRFEQAPQVLGEVLEAAGGAAFLKLAAGRGQGFGILRQQQGGIDVPTRFAQTLAALAQIGRAQRNLGDVRRA